MNKPLRVLVVEDSEDDTILLIRELRRGDYEPTYERVQSPEAMQAALGRQSWDLVVADYTMPHFNALAALSLVKDSGLDLPFIIVSGTIGEERAVAAMKAGAHDYLVKGQLARLAPVIERELREVQIRRERKRLEAQFLQAQKMEAIGQLTAGIAHDFNNLLTAIIFNAQFMQMNLPSEHPLQAQADTISQASSRAADLIRQLLIFSRKQITSPRTVKLNKAITEMSQLLERVIGENIEVKLKLAPDLWSVKIDPTQLEQVVVNLVVNARDAMPDGGKLILETANLEMSVTAVAGSIDLEPGNYVLLTVSDTGIGMSQEVQARLFEPFFTTKEVGKGTGLGLSTVYGIVTQIGGCIGVYSEEAKGSSFKVYLPRSQVETEQTAPASPKREEQGGDETILLVEDDAVIRKLAKDVLLEHGYTVLDAEDGIQGLQVAASHTGPIHLLLTDVIMPGLSGKALAEELTKENPQISVLYMSGYSDEVISHHGILEPGLVLLEKPFNLVEMTRKVREVLGHS